VNKKVKNIQFILDKLESASKRAIIPKIPRSFFPLLHIFGIVLLQSKELKEAIIIILDKEEKVVKHLEIFKKAALNELIEYEIKIRSYLEINNIYNLELIHFLNEFQSHLKNPEPLISRLRFELTQALSILLHDNKVNHDNFLEIFGEIKQINDYRYIPNAFPKCDAWQNETLYIDQIKLTTDWYGLKQIMVFFERYDFRHNDKVINELAKKGLEIDKLHDESIALMKHASANQEMPSKLFPTIEEYKSYMIKIIESIKEIISSSAVKFEDMQYTCAYSIDTAQMLIDGYTPIQFTSGLKPDELLAKTSRHKDKQLSFKIIFNDLKLFKDGGRIKGELSNSENKIVKNLIENTNDRFFTSGFPNFFVIQNIEGSLTQKCVLVSAAYKLIKSS